MENVIIILLEQFYFVWEMYQFVESAEMENK
jgi:hypothetical protein